MAGTAEELLAAVRQVEDTVGPLARANSQIGESLALLEKHLILLKTAAANSTEYNNNETHNNYST